MSALQQAKAAVQEGIALVKDRQKVIKLADRSELGWAVVNEYGEKTMFLMWRDGAPEVKLPKESAIQNIWPKGCDLLR